MGNKTSDTANTTMPENTHNASPRLLAMHAEQCAVRPKLDSAPPAKMVSGSFSEVRLTHISAMALSSMITCVYGHLDPYALIRRASDGFVLAKSEAVKNSLNPTWRALAVPADLIGDGRVRIEVHNANVLNVEQLIGACELNLLDGVDQFDAMPLTREQDGAQQTGGFHGSVP